MKKIYKVLMSIALLFSLTTQLNIENNIYAQETNIDEKTEKTGTVGNTIAEIFVDNALEREVALYYNVSVNTVLTQEMADQMIEIDFSNSNIFNITGIEVFTNAEKLNLSGNEISELPTEIGNLTKLIEIDLSYNKITSLPESIGQLSNLLVLNINNNMLISLPDGIYNLENLESLKLENNQLKSLSEDIEKLSKLKFLSLKSNWELEQVPLNIVKMSNLYSLDLSLLGLNYLPEGVYDLPNLRSLDLTFNDLSTLPPGVTNLENLTDLVLKGNNFTTLPDNIGNLQELNNLDISVNELIALPEGISNLSKLTFLDASYNQITTIPTSFENVIKNKPQMNFEYNFLPSTYADAFNDISNSDVYEYNYQRSIYIDIYYNLYAKDYNISSLNDFESIDLYPYVALGSQAELLESHNLIMENYRDENGNSVNIEDYFENGQVAKNGSVFVQIRVTGEGMFPNNSDNAITKDSLELVFKKPNYYALDFDLNGAVGEVPIQQSLLEGEVAAMVADPVMDGYTFMGWNTQSDGSGVNGILGETAMPAKNVKLFAIWKQNNNLNVVSENPPSTLPKTGSSLNLFGVVSLFVIAVLGKLKFK